MKIRCMHSGTPTRNRHGRNIWLWNQTYWSPFWHYIFMTGINFSSLSSNTKGTFLLKKQSPTDQPRAFIQKHHDKYPYLTPPSTPGFLPIQRLQRNLKFADFHWEIEEVKERKFFLYWWKFLEPQVNSFLFNPFSHLLCRWNKRGGNCKGSTGDLWSSCGKMKKVWMYQKFNYHWKDCQNFVIVAQGLQLKWTPRKDLGLRPLRSAISHWFLLTDQWSYSV